MRKALLAAVIGCSFFIACKNSGSSIDNVSFDSSVAKNATPATGANNLAAPSVAPQTITPQTSLQTAPAVTPPVTAAPAPTAAGMNPPHGQPGHRCDIAVGAPLNTPVAKTTAAPATTTTPQPITLNTNPAPATKTAPGMNPPHGQPGHRCDIAVGAPLNSAPAKTVTPATVDINNKPAETINKNLAAPAVIPDTTKQ